MDNLQNSIEPLNRLLRGELSAVETYDQALDRVGNESLRRELERISSEHENAVEILRQEIREAGGIPDEGSGAWGVWAMAVEGTAALFGESTALKALKEGEEHGLKEYRTVLEDPKLPLQYQEVLSQKLRLRQEEHIAALDRCLTQLH